MIMREEVKCPVCGSIEIIYHEMKEEHIDLSTIYQTWEGHCDECEAILKWVEEYRLHNVEKPIVIK